MWKEAVAETGIIFYLMLGVGIVGILAKVMNYVTLRKLVNAAGSMSKSTHKLMKLVRAKYEHACMVHDRVENVNAFVENTYLETDPDSVDLVCGNSGGDWSCGTFHGAWIL